MQKKYPYIMDHTISPDVSHELDGLDFKTTNNKVVGVSNLEQNTLNFLKDLTKELFGKHLHKHALAKLKKQLALKHKLRKIPKDELLNAYEPRLKIISKPTRMLSGVTVVALMTKPYNCPHGKCVFCPGGLNSAFGDTPQSYTGLEPAARRALLNNYDPYLQSFNRLEQYILLGQIPQKIEVIIMGGTFPAMPKPYIEWFVSNVFKAFNDFSDMFFISRKKNDGNGITQIRYEFNYKAFKLFQRYRPVIMNELASSSQSLQSSNRKNNTNLIFEQKRNELSAVRCVGLTIETKPDWGFITHGNEMLELGVTRIELGVQSLNNHVLKITNRGHTVEDTIKSFSDLRDLGFKINAHVMLGLPGSSMEDDLNTFKELFNNPSYRPDMLKIYPTLVVKGTALYKQWLNGKYKPITTDQASEIMVEVKKIIPRYCRIMRIQRDIPSNVIVAGVKASNLRQIISKKLKERGIKCQCIRCREASRRLLQNPIKQEQVDVNVLEYEASKGREFFISIDYDDALIGFCRLRLLPRNLRPEMQHKTAIIRELHVYGKALPLAVRSNKSTQHRGFGKLLLDKAEQIAIKKGFEKMLVISGVGVRQYYKMLGYRLEGVYMAKML